ncbi:hypothetical protein ACQVTR_25745, partial [Bacillus paranthracis]
SPEYFRNGTVKKQSQYIQVDLEHIMNNLKPGQTYEIKEAYIGMIQDHLYLFYQAIQNTQEITKILIRLFTLLQKNGRKSHRYEKKTVFDIMGVVYEYTGLEKQKKAA